MKILVFSDSHGDGALMSKVLKKTNTDVEMVFHLGDCTEDIVTLKSTYPGIKFYGVRGNSDYFTGDGVEAEIIVDVRDRRILLTHGHKYNVKYGFQRITYAAEEKEVDACLFGHTHRPAIFECGAMLFMNPGSISQPRGVPYPSYGVLDISDSGVIKGLIVDKV